MRPHTEFTGEYLGTLKIQDQVWRRAYWIGWRDEVRRYCERCPECTRYHRRGRLDKVRCKKRLSELPGNGSPLT